MNGRFTSHFAGTCNVQGAILCLTGADIYKHKIVRQIEFQGIFEDWRAFCWHSSVTAG